MIKVIFISIVAIIFCSCRALGQSIPKGIYEPKTIFYSTPSKDKNGFINFKFKAGEKPKNNYRFYFDTDHITLKLEKYVFLKIDKIDTQYNNDVKYWVTDRQGRHFEIIAYKNESGWFDDIDYIILDKAQNAISLTKIILK